MAEKLEVSLGDRIVITSSEIGTNQMVQELFRVSGIVQFGPKEIDESFAFVNLSNAQHMFNIGSGVHQIALRFNNPELANLWMNGFVASFNALVAVNGTAEGMFLTQ